MSTLKTNYLLMIGIGAFITSIACIIEMAITALEAEYGLCIVWSLAGIGFGTLTYIVGDYMEYRRTSEKTVSTYEKTIMLYQDEVSELRNE
ncbi:MAG: hypothetical protein A2Z74_04730 [Chloroflexi bacterium RBG_13_46_9]|nr:MAG: hypothetical protein A2Z74_04730 [Chloroflexi bacterium RBG_13_46_9]